MTAVPLSQHGYCAHRRYRLTCAQFDDLRRHALDRCQICGATQSGLGKRSLSIDHDSALGQWAVRGLLCAACNSGLPQMSGKAVDAYLANPWYHLAGLVGPAPISPPNIPLVDQATALRMIDTANTRYLVTVSFGDRAALAEARAELRHAVRAAIRSGMRLADIARATGHTWNKDQVYAARFENGLKVV